MATVAYFLFLTNTVTYLAAKAVTPLSTKSITLPTGTGRIYGTNGTIFLHCHECFGHGTKILPTADPLCKYGCGTFRKYPTETPNSPIALIMKDLKVSDKERNTKSYKTIKSSSPFVKFAVLGVMCLFICIGFVAYFLRKPTRQRLKDPKKTEIATIHHV